MWLETMLRLDWAYEKSSEDKIVAVRKQNGHKVSCQVQSQRNQSQGQNGTNDILREVLAQHHTELPYDKNRARTSSWGKGMRRG